MTDGEHTPETGTATDGTRNRPHDSLTRRSVLGTLGAGVTALALGGTASPAAATGEDSPAAEYADAVTTETTATSDGNWSEPATWDNGVPGLEANVRIESGTTVTVDETTSDIATLDVAGTLEFPTDSDSELRAETIVTRPDSTLEIGTESTPIDPDSEARITFVHHDDIDEEIDPNRISKGLIVMGDLDIYGAERSGWHELASPPTAGDTTLELAESPTGWQAEDTIVVPGLNPDIDNREDEELEIASISGTTVELNNALEYDHTPPETDAAALSAYALNLSRNVVVESEEQATDPENEQQVNKQGHVMIMSTNSSVHNARFRHVGRTNKRYYFDNPKYGADSVPESGTYVAEEPNPRARYGFHYHQTGIDEADGHEASGVVVQHSPGWGLVNHHSYADVTDCITYEVLGSGFVAEGGDERGSFVGNFALRSRGSGQPIDARQAPNEDIVDINDFGHAGHGFWLQGPVVTVEDNVAAGHRAYAYSLWNRPLYDEEEFTVDDFATHRGQTANFPLEYAEDAGLLPDAMESQLDSGELTDSRVSTSHLNVNSFDTNTAFASAGGLDVANHNFDNAHTDTTNYSQIANFTAYALTSFVDRSGDELYPQLGGNNRGMGGNTGVSIRYSNNVTLTDSTLLNDGGHGVRRNFYPRSGTVENSTIDGFDVGVQTIDTGDGEIRDIEFRDTSTDIYVTSLGDIGAFNLDIADVEFSDSETDVQLHDNWSVFLPNRFSADGPNLTYEGRTIYFDAQDPEFVPYPDEDEVDRQIANTADWGSVFGLEDREAATDELVGLTNQQLQDQYGVSIYGELTPDSAVESPHVESGTIEAPDNTAPTASFSAATDGLSITVDASGSSDSDGSISSYAWTFGDGTSATGQSASHSYGSGGDYDVTLTVTDDDGATATSTQTVSVAAPNSAPTSAFSTTTDGLSLSVDAGGSSDSDGSISSYEWSFDDGTTATGQSVSHSYGSGGDYEVTLTVTDDDGATASSTQTVSVAEPEQTVSEAIDADDDGDIDDDEIIDALDYWENEETVPGTGGETISDQEVMDLIERWHDGGG